MIVCSDCGCVGSEPEGDTRSELRDRGIQIAMVQILSTVLHDKLQNSGGGYYYYLEERIFEDGMSTSATR